MTKNIFLSSLMLILASLLISCAPNLNSTPVNSNNNLLKERVKTNITKTKASSKLPLNETSNYQEVGVASWYGGGDGLHGKKTASGDIFDKRSLTAAHKTLPLPSVIKVTNLHNNRSIILMVNDRGPFSNKRILDVSERAADELGMKLQGSAKIKLEHLAYESQQLIKKLELKEQFIGTREANQKIASNNKKHAPVKIAAKLNKVKANKKDCYIQIGSFKNKNNASKVARKLAYLGVVDVAKVNNIYRVRLGPIKSEKAENLLDKIIQAGNKDAILLAGKS
jgi:rare lipoprotein A